MLPPGRVKWEMLGDSDHGNKENQAPASDAWEDDIGLLRPIKEDEEVEVREPCRCDARLNAHHYI